MKRKFFGLNNGAFILPISLLVILVINNCKSGLQETESRANWNAAITESVPLKVRQGMYKKGNLVQNHSFETGKYFLKSPEISVAHINGWTRIGKSVTWVDLDKPEDHPEDVFKGKHAVKIHRTKANETDRTGEGILSDYIRIIPGNYSFYYQAKLQNIEPQSGRKGTKLYEAVYIEIRFFDKNKTPLKGNQYYPYKKIFLDSGFKGYSFSNFWHIDSLGWGNIRARTYNYPLSEGDVPDGTHFVRLFFGLKGTGTIWVDEVDFRYSKWNFTTLERMTPYFDTVCSLTKMLIPEPKQISEAEPVQLFRYDLGRYHAPLILIPGNPEKEDLMAAKLLRNKLNDFRRNHDWTSQVTRVQIQQGGPVSSYFKGMVFSIGKTGIFKQWKDSLPFDRISDQPEGYLIRTVGTEKKKIILVGNKARGDYYAVTTVVQLFDRQENIFYDASVVDYPDFKGRSYLFTAWQNQNEMERDILDISRMSRLKLNTAYVGYGQTRGRKNWYAPDNLYIKGVKKAGEICRNTGVMDMAVMVNPYYHFDYEMNVDSIPESLKQQFVHARQESLDKLEHVFKIGLDAGARTIMLMADDFVPHRGENRKNYVLYTKEDKDKFVNLQNAQAHVINTIDKWLNQNYPGTRFEFCPPWYLNEFIDRSEGSAESYFRDLQAMVPRNLAIIWTGPTVRSLSFDLADIERYSNLIGRKPMIWDNTLYARELEGVYGGYPAYYPGKDRLCNLFEPYDVSVPENFQDLVDSGAMYVNGSASSEIYKIKYATVADFEWNTRAYNPEFSLWKVLVNNFGTEGGKHLIEFSDAFYGIKEIIGRSKEQFSPKLHAIGQEHVARIHDLFKDLKRELKQNPQLVYELENKMNTVLEEFDALKKQEKIKEKG